MSFNECSDVRVAVPSDADAIFDIMRLAHAEAGEHNLSEEKVRYRISLAVNRRGSLIGVIGNVGNSLSGYVYMLVDQIWYSDDWQLLELSNFVHPEHRRSTYAKQLIAFSKQCANDMKLDLMMGVVSNSRTEAKCRLYRRQLPMVGEFYCYKGSRDTNNIGGVVGV